SAATPVGGDGFGSALAVDGSTLFVGQVSVPPAPPQTGRGGGRGAQQPPPVAPPDTAVGTVQLFRRGADMKWGHVGALTATQTGGAQFGSAIVVSGSLALVGAP